MTYTITKNANFGSIEIHFDGKPAQTVREALKALKFRWHGVRRVWYGYADAQTVQEAIGKTAARAAQPADGTEQAQAAKPGAEQNEQEQLKSEYLQILAGSVWKNSPDMIEYEKKNLARVIRLSDGRLFGIEKPRIKKDFCFGYGCQSGFDNQKEAETAAEHAKSAEYFKQENLRDFNPFESDLARNCGTLYAAERYKDTPEIVYIRHISISQLYRMSEQEKSGYRELSGADIAAIRAGYETEKTTFEKRLDAYLKRYGTSKLHSWAYWADV